MIVIKQSDIEYNEMFHMGCVKCCYVVINYHRWQRRKMKSEWHLIFFFKQF